MSSSLISNRIKTIALILAISLLVNVIGYWITTSTIGDERLYLTEAYLLQKYGSFPHIYPFLPLLSSISLLCFGVSKSTFLLVPISASTLLTILVYYFSLNLFNNKRRAIITAFFVISNPLMVWLSPKHMTETLFALMLLATFYFVARNDLSLKQAFIGGLFAVFVYLTKYPGLLIIPFIIISFLWIKKKPRFILAFLLPAFLLILYWMYNNILFGTPFPSEEYSISFVQGLMNVNLQLSFEIIFKILLGLGLLFAYLLPIVIQSIETWKRKISYSTFSNLSYNKKIIILFIIIYSFIHMGYFILISLSSQIAWSADHLARYLLPIIPLILLFVDFPIKSEGKKTILLIIVMSIGIFMGYYMILYSNVLSQAPLLWEDFLAQLVDI